MPGINSQWLYGQFISSPFCLLRHPPAAIPRLRLSSLRRYSSKYDNLRVELVNRRLPSLYEYLVPDQSQRLKVSLSSFVPPSWIKYAGFISRDDYALLPPAHHLVYFNRMINPHRPLTDGTDPLQSPGPPFVRRF